MHNKLDLSVARVFWLASHFDWLVKGVVPSADKPKYNTLSLGFFCLVHDLTEAVDAADAVLGRLVNQHWFLRQKPSIEGERVFEPTDWNAFIPELYFNRSAIIVSFTSETFD